MATRPLTPKQLRFVEEYLVDLNATAAYKRAGYRVRSDTVARVESSRLLAKPNIAAAIAAAQTQRAERTEITQDYVLTRLQENLERAMQAEPVRDREGSPTGEYTYQGSVANRALELLGKHLGMFRDKVEVTGTDGGPVESAVIHDVADRLAPYANAISAFLGSSGTLRPDGCAKPVDNPQAPPEASAVPVI